MANANIQAVAPEFHSENILRQTQKVSKCSNGHPRISLWNLKLIEAGFGFGQPIEIQATGNQLKIIPVQNAARKVSKVRNHGKTLPVIDLKQTKSLELDVIFKIGESVQIEIFQDLIVVSKPTSLISTTDDDCSPKISVDEIVDFVGRHEGVTFKTSGGRAKFRVTKKEKGIEYEVISSGNSRLHGWDYLRRVADQFNLVRSFNHKHYKHLTVNASYHLSLVREILLEKGYDVADLSEWSVFKPTADRQELEVRSRRLGKLKVREKAKGRMKPNKVTKQTESYERDPNVVREVLDRAGDYCELCKKPAPFRKDYGEPFLEVHHVVPLADKGPDIVANAVGVCPNCHREVHSGQERERLTQQLKEFLAEASD